MMGQMTKNVAKFELQFSRLYSNPKHLMVREPLVKHCLYMVVLKVF